MGGGGQLLALPVSILHIKLGGHSFCQEPRGFLDRYVRGGTDIMSLIIIVSSTSQCIKNKIQVWNSGLAFLRAHTLTRLHALFWKSTLVNKLNASTTGPYNISTEHY